MTKLTRRSLIGAAATMAGAYPLRAQFRKTSAEALREAAEELGHVHATQGIPRQKLKITDVKVTLLSWVDPSPEKDLWRTDDYIVWKTDAAIVSVYTDQGIVGIGGGGRGSMAMKRYAEEIAKPILTGKNPFDIDFIASCAGGGTYSVPGNQPHSVDAPWSPSLLPQAVVSVRNSVWAAVNNACWDIIGKALNQPVYRLLAKDDKPEPHLRVYASGGDYHEWYKDGEQTLLDEALKYKQQGFTAFKFRSGTDWRYSKMDFKKYIPILYRLREAVGPEMDLMHETLRFQMPPVTLEDTVESFCPALAGLKFLWFEQPLKTIEEYVAVKRALGNVMVSGGENERSRIDIQPWIDADAIDIVQTDCITTGISENWHIASMAEVRGKYHVPHNWGGGLTTMANAHLVAAIPNRLMLEINQTPNALMDEIFQEPFRVKHGYLDMPTRPGFGMELVPDVARKFPWIPGAAQRPNPRMEAI